MCMCVDVHVHVHVEAKIRCEMFPSISLGFIYEAGLTKPGTLTWLDLMAIEPQGSSGLFSVLGLHICTSVPSVFMGPGSPVSGSHAYMVSS